MVLMPAMILVPAGAASAAPGETSLTVSVPPAARPGSTVPAEVTLARADDATPIAGAQVSVERLGADQTWTPIGIATTDANGAARVPVVASGAQVVLRARYDGDPPNLPSTSSPATIVVRRVASRLAIGGPRAIVDERTGALAISWTGADGAPVTGAVAVYQHTYRRPWVRIAVLRTGATGRVSLAVRPRVDTWYRFVGAAGPGWLAPPAVDWAIDNRPPLRPVVLPRYAPRPSPLPAQRRAVGSGANVVVRAIPDRVWDRMTGISWHRGCIGRSSLRYLESNYWGFDGYRHRGELVVRASVVPKFRVALARLYAARVPIRAMYLPDRFGYSRRSGGANDYASMRHDNTSAFNCRWVTGNPGVRSPHASGRSIDLNPFENPYRSREGWLPNSWWAGRQAGLYSWRSGGHPVVRIMRASGFRWTYGTFDAQHFDGRTLPARVGH